MKKKICLTLVLCLILSIFTGCGSKKPFGMEIEDLRTKLNENTKTLGYDITVPEFEIKYGTIIENGKPAKEDKNLISYTCYINDDLHLEFTPRFETSGSHAFLRLVYPSDATEEEKVQLYNNMLATASGIIVTIDPKADENKIFEQLKIASVSDSSSTYNTEDYEYKSETKTEYRSKTFIISQR